MLRLMPTLGGLIAVNARRDEQRQRHDHVILRARSFSLFGRARSAPQHAAGYLDGLDSWTYFPVKHLCACALGLTGRRVQPSQLSHKPTGIAFVRHFFAIVSDT